MDSLPQPSRTKPWRVGLPSLQLCAVFLMLSAPIFAAASSQCEPVLGSLQRVDTVPNHSFSDWTVGATRSSEEAVFVAGSHYIKTGGRWSRQALHIRLRSNEEIAESKNKCQLVRSEVVAGQDAFLYSMQPIGTEIPFNNFLVWISKASGLPLREEITIDTPMSTSMVTTWEYENVTVPDL
jgi:hypothetical protein